MVETQCVFGTAPTRERTSTLRACERGRQAVFHVCPGAIERERAEKEGKRARGVKRRRVPCCGGRSEKGVL